MTQGRVLGWVWLWVPKLMLELYALEWPRVLVRLPWRVLQVYSCVLRR